MKKISNDISELGKWISLPKDITSVNWLVQPVVSKFGAVPGPSDTRLYAILALPKSAVNLLPIAPYQTTVRLPVILAQTLIPDQTLSTLKVDGDWVVLTETNYDASLFQRMPYHGVYAIQVGEYVLVCLQTM